METDQISPRQRAWITRRKKYGQHGHAGSYRRDRYAAPHDLFTITAVSPAQSAALLHRLRGMLSTLQEEDRDLEKLLRQTKSQMEIVSETIDLMDRMTKGGQERNRD